jgi:hypothetical protein
MNVDVNVAVADSPALIAVDAVPIVRVFVAVTPDRIAADEGATERTPRPNAATATSATRLNVVFVDICFLSIVELRTIRISALELISQLLSIHRTC